MDDGRRLNWVQKEHNSALGMQLLQRSERRYLESKAWLVGRVKATSLSTRIQVVVLFESVVSEPSTSTSSLISQRVSEKCVLLCKRSIRRMFEIPMDVGLWWYPVWTSSPVPFK